MMAKKHHQASRLRNKNTRELKKEEQAIIEITLKQLLRIERGNFPIENS